MTRRDRDILFFTTEGWTVPEIVARLRCGKHAITEVRKRYGITLRRGEMFRLARRGRG